MFYKWSERDFIIVPAYELKKGDEIAYGLGGDLKYGAIPIKSITKVRGEGILLQYTLPTGAIAESSPINKITIFWQGSRPLIQISQHIKFHDRILIRQRS